MDKVMQFKKWMSERTGHSAQLKLALDAVNELEQELIRTQMVVTEIQDLSSNVSCYVENLNQCNLMHKAKAMNDCLEIGSKIRDLDVPEFTYIKTKE